MAVSKLTRYVTYQSSPEIFEQAIFLVNQAMRENRIDWKETGWVDGLKSTIENGYCPNDRQIDYVNKTLTTLNAPYPLQVAERSKVLTV